MSNPDEIVQLLETILSDRQNRKLNVEKLINIVQENELQNFTTESAEILQSLSRSVDYYEPNPEWRKGSSSYYGDDILELVITRALKALKDIEFSLKQAH